MKKLYVFDLDGTLLTGNFKLVDDYFRSKFKDKADDFLERMPQLLDRYEKSYSMYEEDSLSEYLTDKTNLYFSPKTIQEWNHLVGEADDTKEEHVIEVLESLKKQDKKIAVLTNWFGDSQQKRLRKEGLTEYLDDFMGGDVVTKPHKRAYSFITSGYYPDECVFIGDNVDNDYIGPKACGIDAILYDKNDQHHKSLVKVKSLDEIIKR